MATTDRVQPPCAKDASDQPAYLVCSRSLVVRLVLPNIFHVPHSMILRRVSKSVEFGLYCVVVKCVEFCHVTADDVDINEKLVTV